MMSNIEIAQARDRLREESISPTEIALDVAPPAADGPAHNRHETEHCEKSCREWLPE
jgi:hypothetical protein